MLQRILLAALIISVLYLTVATSTAFATYCTNAPSTSVCYAPCPSGYTCQLGTGHVTQTTGINGPQCVPGGGEYSTGTCVSSTSTTSTTSTTSSTSTSVTSTSSTTSTSLTSTSSTSSSSTTSSSVTTIYGHFSNTIDYPTSYSFTTDYNVPECNLVSSTSPQTTTPPINSVVSTDNSNSVWLLTAPNAPHYNPTDDYEIISNPSTFIAGDECLADRSPLITTISYDTQVTYTDTQTANANLVNWQVNNAAAPSVSNLGFSPMVDSQISSNWQTSTYIFNHIPSAVQHDIWAWSAKFANFNNAQQPYESSPVNLNGLPYQYSYTNNGIVGWCTYT